MTLRAEQTIRRKANGNYGDKKRQQATWGFVQAGLDVQTSAVCIAVLWFGLDGILLGF